MRVRAASSRTIALATSAPRVLIGLAINYSIFPQLEEKSDPCHAPLSVEREDFYEQKAGQTPRIRVFSNPPNRVGDYPPVVA
jgi:hypothetical protein